MDEKDNNNQAASGTNKPPAKRYIRLKPFTFVMLVFGLVLMTTVITFYINCW